jgi:hypothetical protein
MPLDCRTFLRAAPPFRSGKALPYRSELLFELEAMPPRLRGAASLLSGFVPGEAEPYRTAERQSRHRGASTEALVLRR